MKRLGRISVLTLSIIGLSLILGIATSHSVRAAVSALVTVTNTSANPVPTQSVDAQNAFQTQLTATFAEAPQQVAIPPGQRLVVEFVTITGDVFSPGVTQPVVILGSSLNGGGSASYYFSPVQTAVTGGLQSSMAQPVKVYADALLVSAGYAGATPTGFTLSVAISGHLVPIP
jgi:hypothetical protein